MLYSVKRSGTFNTKATPDSPCGSREFQYTVEVKSPALDGRKFVADHVDIDQSIRDFFSGHTITGSCEQVCDKVGKLAAQWIDDSILAGSDLDVTIQGTAALRLIGTAEEFGKLNLKAVKSRRGH